MHPTNIQKETIFAGVFEILLKLVCVALFFLLVSLKIKLSFKFFTSVFRNISSENIARKMDQMFVEKALIELGENDLRRTQSIAQLREWIAKSSFLKDTLIGEIIKFTAKFKQVTIN